MKMTRTLQLVPIVVLSAALAIAQQNVQTNAARTITHSAHSTPATLGSLSGQVRDSAGTPLLGAAVQVFTTASPLAAIVYTDAMGHFSLGNLLPGSYQV